MTKAIPKFLLWMLIFFLLIAGGVSAVLAEDGGGTYSLSIQGSSTVPESTQSQFSAYFNGSRVSASWSLSSTTYAYISSSGLLTARSVSSNQTVTVRARYSWNGTSYSASKAVTITNTSSGTVSLSSLAITGPSSVNSGSSASYTATATFSNGTTQNVTTSASWSATRGTISNGTYSPGTVSTNQTATLTASYTYGGVTRSANTTVTIVAPSSTVTLSSLAVTGPSSVNSGTSAAYTATATFSNGTTQNVTSAASWSVGPVVGTISGGVYSPGTVTTNTPVTLLASYTSNGVTRSASIAVTVLAPTSSSTLSSLAITGPASVTSGSSAVYTATATFSNGSTQNVSSSASWSATRGTISGGNYSPGTVTTNTNATISASYTSGGVTKSTSVTVTITVQTTSSGSYQVFAYNDLGMHCYDADFSESAVLPLYNVLRSQVILKGLTPQIMTNSNVNVTYQAVADAAGSINRTSAGKTNFWTYVQKLFGVSLAADTGIKGQKMPGTANTPQPFASPFDTTMNYFGAEGIPITCYDDANKFNAEPLMRVSALSSTGAVLSTLDTVVPASNEMNCSNCHVTGGEAANQATATKYGISNTAWSTNTNVGNQTKENIMILHDGANHTTLMANRPVLCASCHYSPALDLNHTGPTGAQVGPKYLSRAMHQHHGLTMNGTVPSTTNGAAIVSGSGGTSACYQCHPGVNTKCLRGAMATAGQTCESCHGDMLAVGGYYNLTTGVQRTPWVDEPKCQSCHTGDAVSHMGTSLIGTQAYSSTDKSATPIVATNNRFAEPANTLYRFSTGHGGVACEACHGSTHAEWPTSSANDNVAATQIQGHSGVIAECTACHGTGLTRSLNGPHGMHNVNDPTFYNGGHESFLGTSGANCKTCHGTDGLGTALSKAKANRTFTLSSRTVTVTAGTPIACNLCHSNYINGGG